MNRFDLLAEANRVESELEELKGMLQDGGAEDRSASRNGIEAVRSDAADWAERVASLLQSTADEMDEAEVERWEAVLESLTAVAGDEAALMDAAPAGAPQP